MVELSTEEQHYFRGYEDGQKEAAMNFRQHLSLINVRAIDGLYSKRDMINHISMLITESEKK